jgi:hypothetical protein
MKQRTIELLKYAEMEMDYFEPISYRQREWDRLCKQYSEKACWIKLIELCERGYTNYGTSPRGSWLEDKGKQTLKELG